MLEINGNYIEFIDKADSKGWKEIYLNGVNTYADFYYDSYGCSFMSDPEEFCKEYMNNDFNSQLKRKPKSKYIDMKIREIIADIAPHLLID